MNDFCDIPYLGLVLVLVNPNVSKVRVTSSAATSVALSFNRNGRCWRLTAGSWRVPMPPRRSLKVKRRQTKRRPPAKRVAKGVVLVGEGFVDERSEERGSGGEEERSEEQFVATRNARGEASSRRVIQCINVLLAALSRFSSILTHPSNVSPLGLVVFPVGGAPDAARKLPIAAERGASRADRCVSTSLHFKSAQCCVRTRTF